MSTELFSLILRQQQSWLGDIPPDGGVLSGIYVFLLGGGLMGLVAAVAGFVFWAWMLVDAIRRGEYIWAALIFFFSVPTAILYFLMVYLPQGGSLSSTSGFELPGAHDRRRIAKLKADIHHLDKPHLHLQLGDIYFQQGKLEDAEASYRKAYERDQEDLDIRSHLGQTLLRRGNAKDALPLLAGVVEENPKHDYCHTMMALAEAKAKMEDVDGAIVCWRKVLQMSGYSRARVQLAELLIARKENAEASKLLREVIDDEPHLPAFQRRKEKPWVRRAKSLAGRLPRPA
ncbi:MAG: tetratricopeptide repeat protein [Candidatus Methylacidiphilales bacterium]|nr:tetratricopeptide repeat protein [Candidatus Methylacidiphilales bacterium]